MHAIRPANGRAAVPELLRDLGLTDYVLELELDGLTVVPPEVHGVPIEAFDRMTQMILDRAEELVGCPFSLDRGPHAPVEFPDTPDGLTAAGGERSQFLIQQLTRLHRDFRDLVVNPVAVALIRHLIGSHATRLSSTNSFVKWKGDFGYGPVLGLHADQTAVPPPWGSRALTSNTNWCLTDYTEEGGALVYVPGSHRKGRRPDLPKATRDAVVVEAPKGSVIVFHGATWHGAVPRQTPGMRISIANYYRHMMITSQEDIKGTFPPGLAADCDDPEMFRQLVGYTDPFPYADPNEVVPRAVT